MQKKPPSSAGPAQVRRRAEAHLRGQKKLKAGVAKTGADFRRLLHELEVHQIELEMQNAELRRARDEREASLENYTDLYDFAPVGYFTLTAAGVINQVNLTGTNMVEMERSRLVGRTFGMLVTPELRPIFYAFLKKVFAGQTKASIDLALLGQSGQPLRDVNLEAQPLPNGQECRVAVIDITERKLADSALRMSEERYRNLFNSMDEGYCVIEMIFDKYQQPVDYRFVEVNRAFEKQSGMHDVVGKRMLEFVPAIETHWLANYGKVALTGEPIRFDSEYKGLNRWFDVYAFRIGGNDSRKVAILFNNITERRQAEAALRQSEDRYRTLFTSIDEGFCIIESIFDENDKPVDYRFLEVNPTFEKQTGLIGAVGKRMRKLVPDIESHWIEIYGQVALTGESIRFMNEAKAMGGRWFDVYACRVGGAESRKVAIIFNDITERRQIAKELTEKARLLDLTHDAIIVRDVAGHIRYWNHGAEELYGWSQKEVLGKLSHRLLKTEFPIPLKQMIAELHRTDRWIGELWHTKRDGRRITVLARKTLDRDSQGNPASVLEILTDITARKQAEADQRRLEVMTASNRKLELEIIRRKKLAQALKLSEQQSRHLSREILVAQEAERKRISRELHDTVLQTLVGINVQLASLTPKLADNPTSIRQKISQTQRLVDKSLAIVHRFAVELRPTVLDDLGLIPAVHTFMNDFMKRTGVRASLTAYAGVNQLPLDQSSVLYRVALEALNNVAIHAQASAVKVEIKKLPDWICLTITDDGKSFDLKRVLRTKGSGRLGLLGMRERLEMVGGKFSIKSTPGHGTTVTAWIPVTTEGAGKNRKRSLETKS
jgi:PAS domain S-box-containing protein